MSLRTICVILIAGNPDCWKTRNLLNHDPLTCLLLTKRAIITTPVHGLNRSLPGEEVGRTCIRPQGKLY